MADCLSAEAIAAVHTDTVSLGQVTPLPTTLLPGAGGSTTYYLAAWGRWLHYLLLYCLGQVALTTYPLLNCLGQVAPLPTTYYFTTTDGYYCRPRSGGSTAYYFTTTTTTTTTTSTTTTTTTTTATSTTTTTTTTTTAFTTTTTTTTNTTQVARHAELILAGKVAGRVVVDVSQV